MDIVAMATAHSSAPAEDFYARWIDHDSWSEWSPDSEWVRLDGPVSVGTTGTLKPKGGPRIRFSIGTLEPGRRYVDVSRLPGARLTFSHLGDRTTDASGRAVTRLEATVRIEGPLALVWSAFLGKGFRRSVPADLDRLVRLVESARV